MSEQHTEDRPTFTEWAIVEVMGRLKLAGKVTEQTMFGTAMCRVDVYVGDATEPAVTRFFGGQALYGVTPVAEAVARRFALGGVPEPVAKWELPTPTEPADPAISTCQDCGRTLTRSERAVGNGYCAECGSGPVDNEDLEDDPDDDEGPPL